MTRLLPCAVRIGVPKLVGPSRGAGDVMSRQGIGVGCEQGVDVRAACRPYADHGRGAEGDRGVIRLGLEACADRRTGLRGAAGVGRNAGSVFL